MWNSSRERSTALQNNKSIAFIAFIYCTSQPCTRSSPGSRFNEAHLPHQEPHTQHPMGQPSPHTVGLTLVTSSARSQPISPPSLLEGAHFSSLTSTPKGLSSTQVKLVLRSWKLKDLKCRSRRRVTSEPRSSSLRDEGFRQPRVPPLFGGGDGGGRGG